MFMCSSPFSPSVSKISGLLDEQPLHAGSLSSEEHIKRDCKKNVCQRSNVDTNFLNSAWHRVGSHKYLLNIIA